jgi:hypothetical protein
MKEVAGGGRLWKKRKYPHPPENKSFLPAPLLQKTPILCLLSGLSSSETCSVRLTAFPGWPGRHRVRVAERQEVFGPNGQGMIMSLL